MEKEENIAKFCLPKSLTPQKEPLCYWEGLFMIVETFNGGYVIERHGTRYKIKTKDLKIY